MAETTKIEWAHGTFNPWVGCTKLSAACDHCYAEGWAKRAGSPELWTGERRRTTTANWRQVLKWDRRAADEGRRIRIFCASLADVFDNQVPEEWRWDLWELIASTRSIDWLLLTKRPQNIAKMLPVMDSSKPGYKPWNERWPWSNVWLGTTVENQEEADRRIPHLMRVPAIRRFLSMEPLLGPVDLTRVRRFPEAPQEYLNVVAGKVWTDQTGLPNPDPSWIYPGRPVQGEHARAIDWVIVGGESGGNARPSHPQWFRDLRDQCWAHAVPFLFKQNGEWFETDEPDKGTWVGVDPDVAEHDCAFDMSTAAQMIRVGKKRAGRTLDGVIHDEVPA